MKAFVSRIIDGREILGTENQCVSPEYKTLRGLKRFALNYCKPGGIVRVAVYANWDRCYGEPDRIFEWSR